MTGLIRDTPRQTINLKEDKTKVYFPNLDAIRFIAFFSVFLSHTHWGDFLLSATHNSFIKEIINFVFKNGETGVSVFFVLSGFLITYLILIEVEKQGKLDLKAFYFRRTLRIWPLYFVVILFSLEIYPFLKSFMGIFSNLCNSPIYYYLFLSNIDLIKIKHFCATSSDLMSMVTWSVSIEEQFYLIWPIFFLVIPRKFLPYLFLVLIGICFWFRFLNLNDDATLRYHTFSVFGDLIVGALSAYFILYLKGFRTFFENIKGRTVSIVYLLGFVFCIFSVSLEEFSIMKLINRFISTLFFAFIILEQNFSLLKNFRFQKFTLISRGGKYTYGYYLLHPMALLIVDIGYRSLGLSYSGGWSLLCYTLLSFMLTLLAGYISYNFFEVYFIRLKSKFSYVTRN